MKILDISKYSFLWKLSVGILAVVYVASSILALLYYARWQGMLLYNSGNIAASESALSIASWIPDGDRESALTYGRVLALNGRFLQAHAILAKAGYETPNEIRLAMAVAYWAEEPEPVIISSAQRLLAIDSTDDAALIFYAAALVRPIRKLELPLEQKVPGYLRTHDCFGGDTYVALSILQAQLLLAKVSFPITLGQCVDFADSLSDKIFILNDLHFYHDLLTDTHIEPESGE